MDPIVQANIVRFGGLLETESDPNKRAMILRLLAEEKMKEPPPNPQQERQGGSP